MAETLKEFLVGLGFQVDVTSLKKFNEGVVKTTKTAIELGTAAAGAAMAVGAAIVKISDHMEDLYYISQRTGATVENIQGAQYGFSQIGLTAGDATAALEGLKSALRSNPGSENLLNNLGVQTRDAATHQARDTEEVLHDLVGRLRTMPFYLAKQYASMFGIDDKTLLQMENNYDAAGKAMDDFKQRQRAAGIDAQKLSEQSKDFGNELGKLDSDFGILGQRIEIDFLPTARRIIKWADEAVQAFNKIDVATDGAAGRIGVAATALGGFLGLKGALSFLGIGGKSAAVAEVEAVGSAAVASATKIGLIRRALNVGLGVGLGIDAISQINKDTEDEKDMTPEQRKAFEAKNNATGQNSFGKSAFGWIPGLKDVDWSKPIGEEGGLFGPVSSDGKGGGSKIGDAMAYLRKLGWSAAQSAGLVSNIERESGGDPRAVGDHGAAYGIGQWHAPRQAAFKAWAGKDIRDSDLHEQLEFMMHELTQGAEQRAGKLLSMAKNPAEAAEIVSRYYERPADASGEAMLRAKRAGELFDSGGGSSAGGRPPVVISQSTSITVTGAGDAHGTAAAVSGAQTRVNGDLVRNMEGAVR